MINMLKKGLVFLLLCLVANVQAQEKLKVLSSISIFHDMAKEIGGDQIDIESIVPIGSDPHLYRPRPSDVKKVLDADVILVNGLTLEGWIQKLINSSGTKATVKTITDGIDAISNPDHQYAYDPHAWMSAKNGLTYVDNILDVFVQSDPANAAYYKENHKKYRQKISDAHEYIKAEIQKIPRSKRVLVTSHDAFAYYGREYGIANNAIKGISTEEETQSSDIIRVSKAIQASGVPAIFLESTINPKMMQRIAKDNNVMIGGELFADSLGPKGSEGDTYIEMLKHNTDVIVKALSQQINTSTKIDSESGKGSSIWVYLGIGLVMLLLLGLLIAKFK